MLKGLKAARKSRGLSQQELAKAANLSQPYISQLESGRANGRKLRTPYETIALLSNLLVTTPEKLQEGEEDETGRVESQD